MHSDSKHLGAILPPILTLSTREGSTSWEVDGRCSRLTTTTPQKPVALPHHAFFIDSAEDEQASSAGKEELFDTSSGVSSTQRELSSPDRLLQNYPTSLDSGKEQSPSPSTNPVAEAAAVESCTPTTEPEEHRRPPLAATPHVWSCDRTTFPRGTPEASREADRHPLRPDRPQLDQRPAPCAMVVESGDLHGQDEEDDRNLKQVKLEESLKAFHFNEILDDDAREGHENRSRVSTRNHSTACPLASRQVNNCGTSADVCPLNPHHDAQHAYKHTCNNAANCRWLILMEPVNALHISVILGAKGRIFRADDSLAAVLGYDCTNRLFGTELGRLIPSLDTSVEANGREQHCCGTSVRKNGVPFSVVVVVEFDKEENPLSYDVRIRSLASINGVITITDAGVVHSYNEHFLHELCGKKEGEKDEDEVIVITDLIPNFYDASTLASLSADQAIGAAPLSPDELGHNSYIASNHEDQPKRFNSLPQIQVGSFYGLAKHIDRTLIPVRFDVTRLDGQSQPRLFAVGIGYERGIDYGINQCSEEDVDDLVPQTRASSSSEMESDFEVRTMALKDDDENDAALEIKIHDVHLSALADESNEAVCGEYSSHYDTFQLIGNGTFGSVKLAARKDTGLLAVTKFVCKSKVLPESWVKSTSRGGQMVPIEVHLLETLDHKNIVKVLDVFENEKYYQLVMEKLGCGMDLFEFIENHPKMDEPLISYIFRQIVDAVKYLHANGIVHRDLKDENVIIDRNFCCKLIDFGSAAYFGPNIIFSTFCGTMEYCSPEVLTGNKYLGPEVEMWSMGILLYTLVFFQNPFRTPQETIHAEIELVWDVSDQLFHLIGWLLNPDPKHRATIKDVQAHDWVRQKVDPTNYRFQEVLKNSDRARVSPPLYVSDLHNHLKSTSSCGNLANSSFSSIDAPSRPESGVVSAR
ncbi:unnamed protein product [Bursaphelenchus xylophilus]|uniref:(pine wood nematode) hypothetical protein n=1 Tax=Bursaphelenchus xylophilus TaxID=6326 RepID=A0A1I7RK42_BURXY|nr:unnamed protein product [Bursaphelenchus xylophilus]CAG9131523.1 unnamed protein product [Bursaphelenchus xylophilus]